MIWTDRYSSTTLKMKKKWCYYNFQLCVFLLETFIELFRVVKLLILLALIIDKINFATSKYF